MTVARFAVRLLRFARIAALILGLSIFAAGAFVIAIAAHSWGSPTPLEWSAVWQLALLFGLLGALYGSAVVLDASSEFPWPSGKFFRRIQAPVPRTLLCGSIGAGAVVFMQWFHNVPVEWRWVLTGGFVGSALGWLGWRWAKHIH